eukprot:6211802-Pleurochrysis_carterae.AAC.2
MTAVHDDRLAYVFRLVPGGGLALCLAFDQRTFCSQRGGMSARMRVGILYFYIVQIQHSKYTFLGTAASDDVNRGWLDDSALCCKSAPTVEKRTISSWQKKMRSLSLRDTRARPTCSSGCHVQTGLV